MTTSPPLGASAPIESIDQYLALPELELPQTAAQYRCLAVDLFKATVKSKGGPDASEEIRLGAVAIETPSGPAWQRVPIGLTQWASDMSKVARAGGRALPRTVRLERQEHGIHVSYLPEVFTVYVDESGNGGDAAGGLATNFQDQRAFVLVGLGDSGAEGSIADIFAKVSARHRAKTGERKRTRRRDGRLLANLVGELAARHPIFIEAMDKRYFLAGNLVTFAARSQLLHPLRDRTDANAMAELLTDVVDEGALAAYAAFAQMRSPESFEDFKSALRSALLRAKISQGPRERREFLLLQRLERSFEAALEERGWYFLSFLPPPDHLPGGGLLPMLPHVAASNSLLARANLYAHTCTSIRLVHDKQDQFESALRTNTGFLESNGQTLNDFVSGSGIEDRGDFDLAGRVQVEFANSETCVGIQVADHIARHCMRRLKAVLEGQPPPAGFDDFFRLLRRQHEVDADQGLSVVAGTAALNRFWHGI